MQILSTDEFNLISDWYHLAILSLGKLKENRANVTNYPLEMKIVISRSRWDKSSFN